VTAPPKRSLRIETLARIYDAEIAPCWGARFGKLLLRNLAVPERSQVLEVSCGTGSSTVELLRRMTDGSRLIAIDESSAMLDVVRRKVAALGALGPRSKRGVFFRTESAVPRLSFADEVYDLVVCNLGIAEMPSLEGALRDFARVTKPGGEVRCTLPLAGTFDEFHDLYREVLIKHDKHDALDRLEAHVARYPSYGEVTCGLSVAGLAGDVEVEDFTLLFRSARELFFAPVIEYGPLVEWKAIAGDGQEMQDVFWYIKEAIDAYFGDRPFHVTVRAGCVVGRKADRTLERAADDAAFGADIVTTPVPLTFDTEDDSPFDHIETGLPWPPYDIASGSMRLTDAAAAGRAARAADTADSDDFDVEELHSGDISFEDEPIADPELDAFIAGKKRPHHLAD